MTREAIEAAIPHRPPMLLVDEIVRRDERSIVCRKTFRDGEYFFQGHYPGYPLVPGVILSTYRNLGGEVDPLQIIAAVDRGALVPGGACGFMGSCGAAT
ncbi:MAG: DUF5714 domain-containing protein, partial [Planctomycetes bacterium]|nr:DUF5714 domain-containing protein [Planctomycetota bacterium]